MNNNSAPFPLLGILGLIFITLKLSGIGVVATWSWLWVLSPFWIPLAIAFSLIGIAMIFAVIVNRTLK
jgi:hypothetical protein